MRPRLDASLAQLTNRRVGPLIARVLRLSPWPARVQRVGAHTLQRLSARFPALAGLLRMRSPVPPAAAPGSVHAADAVTVEPAPGPAPANATAPPTPEDALPTWRELLQDPSWEARTRAAAALAGSHAPEVRAALCRSLRDESVEVACASASSLAQHSAPEAREALLEVVRNSDGYYNAVTRATCVRALAEYGGGELDWLLPAVTDVDAEVSLAAIAVIAERNPPGGILRLRDLLTDHTGYFLPLVRVAAANALTDLGALTPDAASALLGQEHDPAMRQVLEQVAAQASA
jgi:HEAT repeat protein